MNLWRPALTPVLVCMAALACVSLFFDSDRRTLPAAVVTPAPAQAHFDLVYRTVDGSDLAMDIYLPAVSNRRAPLVVWIHGGGWRAGSKERCPITFLTDSGYAVASINYRLSTVAPFPAQIEDCKAAIRWLRANADTFGFDRERFAVAGASAGGHLASLVGASGDVKGFDKGDNLNYSSRVQAVVSIFGPTDFTRRPEKPFGQLQEAEKLVGQLLGGSPEEKKDLAALASPLTHVTKDDPPFLFIHGDKDTLVPLEQSRVMEKALKQAGIPADLYVMHGVGHGLNDPQALVRLSTFLDHTIGPATRANDRARAPVN